ncbi:MAG: S-methyl-5-thioribose-1-phosphate isomerase [candidate division WOR-3 bacterium]
MIKPFIYEGDKILLLDQRKLPFKEVYIEIRKFENVLKAIKNMSVRGAPLLGIFAGYGLLIGLKEILKRKDYKEKLKERIEKLKNTRPTAYNLFYILKRIENLIEKGAKDFEEYEREIMNFHKEEVLKFERIGEVGREILFKGIRVLTHCNTGFLATGGIGTAFGIIYKNKDLIEEVYFTETRPFLQGARLTSYELHKANIKNKLIFDFEAGIIMQRKLVDIVIVGADRIARNGDFANKTGTLILAILSHYFNIPFYVAAPISTFDLNSKRGDDFIIEERKGEEVKKIGNKRIAPPYTTALYFSFDITPSKLVKGYITEKGILKPPFNL